MTEGKRNASILAAYLRGDNITSIADAHGLTRSGVVKVIRKARNWYGEEVVPYRPDPKTLAAERDAKIAAFVQQGVKAKDIAAQLNLQPAAVYRSIMRSRANNVLPPATFSSDPHRAVQRLRETGHIRGTGRVSDIIDTLTQEQVEYLFREAPKAKSAAEAIAVFLAVNLPEEES